MSERTHSLLYIFQLSTPIRNEYQASTFLGRMINSWSCSWVAHLRHQLVNFHHVMLSRWAAIIFRTGTRSFWEGLHIKVMMLLEGLSLFEIHSNRTQACLISYVWSIKSFWIFGLGWILYHFVSLMNKIFRSAWISQLPRLEWVCFLFFSKYFFLPLKCSSGQLCMLIWKYNGVIKLGLVIVNFSNLARQAPGVL